MVHPDEGFDSVTSFRFSNSVKCGHNGESSLLFHPSIECSTWQGKGVGWVG